MLNISAFYLVKQKKYDLGLSRYQNKKPLFTDPIFSEGFGVCYIGRIQQVPHIFFPNKMGLKSFQKEHSSFQLQVRFSRKNNLNFVYNPTVVSKNCPQKLLLKLQAQVCLQFLLRFFFETKSGVLINPNSQECCQVTCNERIKSILNHGKQGN